MFNLIELFAEPARCSSPALTRHLADSYVIDFLRRTLISGRFDPPVHCADLLSFDVGSAFAVRKIVVANGESAPVSLNELFERKHWFAGFYEFMTYWGLRAALTDKKRAAACLSGVIHIKPTVRTFFKHPRVLKSYLTRLFPRIYFADVPHSKLIIGEGELVCNSPSAVYADAATDIPAAAMDVLRKFFIKYEVNCAFRTRWCRVADADGVYCAAFERTAFYGKALASTRWRIGSCNGLSELRFVDPYDSRVALYFSAAPVVLSADEYRVDVASGAIVPCAQLPLCVTEHPTWYTFVYTTANDAWTGDFSQFAVEFANTLLCDVPTTNLKTSYLAPTVALGLLDKSNTHIDRAHRARIECDVHAYGFTTSLAQPCDFTTTVLQPFYERLFKPCDLQALARDYPPLLKSVVGPLFCNDNELVAMLCATLELLIKRYWTVTFVRLETDARCIDRTFFN